MATYALKVKKEELESHLGQLLKEGRNDIQHEIKKNRCTLYVSYSIIVPAGQKEKTIYAFLLTDSITIEGRGTGTYGEQIKRETLETFEAMEIIHPAIVYSSEADKTVLLTGFKMVENKENEVIYEAVHAEVHFIHFENETTYNVTEIDKDVLSYEISTPEHLTRYAIDDTRYNRKEIDVKILFNESIFKYEGNLSTNEGNTFMITRYEQMGYLDNDNTFFIIDSQNRLWKETASYQEKEDVKAEYKTLLVIDESLYSLTNLFSRLDSKYPYVLIKDRLYCQIETATIYFEKQELKPFIQTNIQANTPLKGSGLYSTILLNGVKTVIVPIEKDYIFSSYETFELVVVNQTIYSVVGKAEEVGFSVSDYRDEYLIISKRPENEYHTYWESLDEVNLNRYQDKGKPIEIEIYDAEFKKRKPKFRKGDEIRVIKELTGTSQLEGLEGIIISLSNNKSKATVRFFHHFEETFPISYIEVVQ